MTVPVIRRLMDHVEHVETVTRWIWEEWGRQSGLALEEARRHLTEPFDCPPTLVALCGKNPAGVLGFRRFQQVGAKTPSLFIDALFVSAAWRGRGIGTALLEKGVASARPYDAELFVYTEARSFYEARGWSLSRSDPVRRAVVLTRATAIEDATGPYRTH